jgi:hypothetical protein
VEFLQRLGREEINVFEHCTLQTFTSVQQWNVLGCGDW